jgi:DNA-binding MarR family transcriptional regulator
MEPTTDREYEQRILRALRRVIRAVDVYSRKLNSEWGLTAQQFFCLHALAESEEMTLTTLAKSVSLGGSTVIGIIDRLEAKHYLRRVRSSTDRRKIFLEITPSGKEIVQKAPPLLPDRFTTALSDLDDQEQKTITESLERIVELMEFEKADIRNTEFF